jgi:hypothetical protein
MSERCECGVKWHGRKFDGQGKPIPPANCPGCNSPYWNKAWIRSHDNRAINAVAPSVGARHGDAKEAV